jgi:hypothetical protein
MQTTRIDALAVVSLAVIVCFLEPVIHEGLGHGVAAVALGAPLQHVSSVDMAADESRLAPWAVRIVSAAGIISNLIFGILAIALLQRLRSASANVRYFLWLLGHSNLFVGSGYMLALSFASFGDIADIVAGLSWALLAQLASTAIGLAIARATFFHAAKTLDEFIGPVDRRRRAIMLTVLPYFVIGIVNTLAGVLNPVGPQYILISAAAASFGGHMPIAYLPFALRVPRPTTPAVPLTPVRDSRWMAAAALSLALLFAILAPGVPR